MKTGVIDIGGGLRGIYAAGVLDYCIDQNIRFDLGIGVSAGSANLASVIRKKYPAAAEMLCQRAMHYNQSVTLAQEYAEQGKVLIVSPDDTCGVDTLKKDKAALNRLYEKGYQDGQKILHYLCETVSKSV